VNPTFVIVLATLVSWTAIAVLLDVLKKRSRASRSHKQILNRLLFSIVGPLALMFAVFTLRILISPSSDYRLIFAGSNMMFMMFLVVGRYQFLSLLSIGNSYKVYAHYIEWVPGILGIALYGLFQLENSDLNNMFPGLDKNLETIPPISYNLLSATLWSAITMIPIVELVFIFFQTNLLKRTSWKSATDRPLLLLHYASILYMISGMFLIFAYVHTNNVYVWRVSLLALIAVMVFELMVCVVSINKVLPLWTKAMSPEGKKDIDIWERFLEILSVEKFYLNPELKMKDVSRELAVKDNELRSAISLRSENSFPVIIGLHRLNHFIEHTSIADLKKKSMDHLAMQSGFNSRSSLHRTCTRWMKMSATEVINSGRGIDITKLL
jgi:AraC-like DNA-binding protein